MTRIKIEEFIALAGKYPVIDVRSPGEYAQAHMPGAYSMPLFNNEERAVVGTIYKQEGRQPAIKKGLEYFGVKMRSMVEEVEAIVKKHGSQVEYTTAQNTVLVHCWRGGMRSAGVAWLLDMYGFKVYTLDGGYKGFRNWVLQQLERDYRFRILGGYTGSGKTRVLEELAKRERVIDLEALANNKGSAFGGLGEEPQPRPEMFENMLALELSKIPENEPIWLEDESRRIGNINLHPGFWLTMRKSPVYFMDIPFEARLDYITGEYGKFKKEDLVNAVVRIQKRLGGLNTKNAVNYLLEGNKKEAFRILLTYYDKFYGHDLLERDNAKELIHTIACDRVDVKVNTLRVRDVLRMQGA
jgi:tRNA 2-selenouridine synthase